ncbi:MAG: CHAD domain-containing protein [Bacteroidales bacterium]|nr:CHAD domain-containing protein [Bacteroidales bacterium]
MKNTTLHGFRIYRQESLSETFRRVVDEQLRISLQLCRQFPEKPDFATHEIRKSTKRVRAVYRLYQQVTGYELYRHGKEFYSHVSHVLADHRISFVYFETLKLISTDRKMPVNAKYLGKLIRAMERYHREASAEIILTREVDQGLYGLLESELRANARELPAQGKFNDLVSCLRKTYSRGQKCLDQATIQPTAENFHEFRKITKSLWNELILIKPIWPSYYGFAIHHLDILAQKLGFEHDLAELEKLLRKKSSGKDRIQCNLLTEYIAWKRKQLQKSIIPLAQRLFADKPGAVARKAEVFYGMFVG